jgi:hypothetical protein
MIRFVLPLSTEKRAEETEGGAAHNEPEQIGNGI